LIAFSTSIARRQVETASVSGKDFRFVDPELFYLGGITTPWAAVRGAEAGDWVIIGSVEPGAPPLTLDDWAVAVRARIAHPSADPGVSIDPLPCRRSGADLATSSCEGGKKQRAVFFAGVGDTHFGKVCFEADWLLKRLGMELEKKRVGELKTFLSLLKATPGGRPDAEGEVGARFWFYPIASRVNVTEQAILLESLQMGVFSEPLSTSAWGPAGNVPPAVLSQWFASASKDWAASVSDNYDDLAHAWPVLDTLRGLTRLAALAKGMAEVRQEGELEYWIRTYPVQPVSTPRDLDVLKVSDAQVGEFEGGVLLMALAVRAQEGDLDAFRELALKIRPTAKSLSWRFQIDFHYNKVQGVTQRASGSANMESIALLYAHAAFLKHQDRLKEAISVYDTVVGMLPRWEGGYNDRGCVYQQRDDLKSALADFNHSIDINPRNPKAFYNRGNNYRLAGERERALADYDHALQLNPTYANAYFNRAVTNFEMGNLTGAMRDIDRTLSLEPQSDEVYYTRGRLYDEMEQYDAALQDYSRAIGINSAHKEAHINHGLILVRKGRYEEALADLNRALEIAPTCPLPYSGRGLVFLQLSQYRKAIEQFDEAVQLDPHVADFYDNRGAAHAYLGEYEAARKDFKQALRLEPNRPNTYLNLCREYLLERSRGMALAACERSVELDRGLAEAYFIRGMIFGEGREYSAAAEEFSKAIAADPNLASAYLNRGSAYAGQGNVEAAKRDWDKAAELRPHGQEADLAHEKLQLLESILRRSISK
jgi:tetratricopeptide (TPR) repeat protein